MENKEEMNSQINNSNTPNSIISDLLPSDLLEEIGVYKVQKNPKVSVSSNNLKYDLLNDEDTIERRSTINSYGSSQFINNFRNSNFYSMDMTGNNNNYIEFRGKINNYPKRRSNFSTQNNQIMIINNPLNHNINISNNNINNMMFNFNNNNLIEGEIKKVNSNKNYILNKNEFLDNNLINNNVNNYNSPKNTNLKNNNNYFNIYWQNMNNGNINIVNNLNNNQVYRKYPINHSNSSQNLPQPNFPLQIPKSRFVHRGSSNQIPVQNKIIPKEERIENKTQSNTNNIINQKNNKSSTLIESQIDNIFSQFQYNEIKNSNQSHLSYLLEKIGSNLFIQIIKTHKGSLNLQKILSNNPPTQKEVEIITLIICMNIQDIICDYYGNYFLQKFLPYCSLMHRLLLYKYIKPNFLSIANDICGNHSLQCLILLQNSKEEENIIKECIEKHLFSLSTASNSSHVIQKVIKAIKESDREYINNFIISNLMELCLDPNGICIVKEFINESKSEFYIMSIVSIFEVETNKLTFDQFGNFGIQEIIKKYGDLYCNKIINKLVDNIIVFSMSKFSSNVVDFVIDYLSKNNIKKFFHILNKIFLNEDNFNEMIKNKFATYVIENSLELINKIDKESFVDSNKDEDNSSSNNNSLSGDYNDKISFDEFNQLKNKIYSVIQNNPIAKEKKKIMKLIKS